MGLSNGAYHWVMYILKFNVFIYNSEKLQVNNFSYSILYIPEYIYIEMCHINIALSIFWYYSFEW